MSERWGGCITCMGTGFNCFHCGGTGFNGYLLDYPRLPKIDRSKHTHAIEMAVRAIQTKGIQMNQEITTIKKHVPVDRKLAIGDLENIFIKGDIGSMNEIQRIEYTKEVCRSLGLNVLTNPFGYIEFDNKGVQLYAKKNCTDQLRAIHDISTDITSIETINDIIRVRVKASLPTGRRDEDMGCVSIKGLVGDRLCNAEMKAITKAKRRSTLSICGLGGMLDESELETVPNARVKDFNQPAPHGDNEPKTIAGPSHAPINVPTLPPVQSFDETQPIITVPPKTPATPITGSPLSRAQVGRLWKLQELARVPKMEVLEWVVMDFGRKCEDELTRTEYDRICNHLIKIAEGHKVKA
jgi:hypothetical protein